MDTPIESSLHRAAVLIKCLPQLQAGRLLGQLEAKELQTLFKQVRSIGEVSPQQRELAIQSFLDSSEVLLTKKKSGQGRDEDRGPFEFLAEINDATRHRILVGEHPQIVATVLSFLPTKTASATLNGFDTEFRVAVLRRLCEVESFDGKEVANISFQLKSRLHRMLKSDRIRQGGIGIATKLLSCTDPKTREKLIDFVDQQDPDLASELRQHVFQFGDLWRLSNSEMKTLLKHVDTSLWAPALRSAPQPLHDAVLRNMGPRPREILNQEIQSSVGVDQLVSTQAQTHVIEACIRLAEQQRITLPGIPANMLANRIS